MVSATRLGRTWDLRLKQRPHCVTDAELGELESLSVDSKRAFNLRAFKADRGMGSPHNCCESENLEATYSVPLRE